MRSVENTSLLAPKALVGGLYRARHQPIGVRGGFRGFSRFFCVFFVVFDFLVKSRASARISSITPPRDGSSALSGGPNLNFQNVDSFFCLVSPCFVFLFFFVLFFVLFLFPSFFVILFYYFLFSFLF